jgi:hypothetical protein
MLCNVSHRDVRCFRHNGLHILDRTSWVHEIRLSVQHSALLVVTGEGGSLLDHTLLTERMPFSSVIKFRTLKLNFAAV